MKEGKDEEINRRIPISDFVTCSMYVKEKLRLLSRTGISTVPRNPKRLIYFVRNTKRPYRLYEPCKTTG